VNEALYYGVPLLVYPQVHDQLIVARRVSKLGAGKTLRGRVTAADLRDAAAQVLADPRYRRRAMELGGTLRSGGGAQRAADEIERFAGVATAVPARTS
jgi:UDP:flavonoid glycosyltransferase YjiC (YdhE family)